MKRLATKRPAATRALAITAWNLYRANVRGDELAVHLKCPPENAQHLAEIGRMIERAEGERLSKTERAAFQAITRVIARNVMLGISHAKTGDVDFAARRRPGWCARTLLGLSARGLIEVGASSPGQIALTSAGWALAWETGFIKKNWTVPA